MFARTNARRAARAVCAACIAALLVLFIYFVPLTRAGADAERAQVELLVLNVGKGDCLLLFVGEKTYMIDAGYARTYGVLKTALDVYGVTRLDGLFITHIDKDHVGGLELLAENDALTVGAVYAPEIYFDVKPEKHPSLLYAQRVGLPLTWLKAGDVLSVAPDAQFTVLGPLVQDMYNENNNSLVLRLDTAQGSMLLTGDMKEDEEKTLLAQGLVKQADVLKVGHHGDSGATSLDFARAVSPQVAVISTSTLEEPDTPDAGVMRRLRTLGAVVGVTQDYGAGISVTLENGRASAHGFAWSGLPPLEEKLSLSYAQETDLLTIRNTGDADVSLNGWMLFFERGEDTHALDTFAIVPAGGALTIGGSKSQDAGYMVDAKRLMHKSKADLCLLIDPYGRLVSSVVNGR